MHFIRTIKKIIKAKQELKTKLDLNGQEYTISDIISSVEADIQNIIDENDLQIEIERLELIGSYMRGENTSGSDLDVLLEYSGNISDDSLFNILSEENLELNGIKIDINPINIAKDSIEDFKERNKGFTKRK